MKIGIVIVFYLTDEMIRYDGSKMNLNFMNIVMINNTRNFVHGTADLNNVQFLKYTKQKG